MKYLCAVVLGLVVFMVLTMEASAGKAQRNNRKKHEKKEKDEKKQAAAEQADEEINNSGLCPDKWLGKHTRKGGAFYVCGPRDGSHIHFYGGNDDLQGHFKVPDTGSQRGGLVRYNIPHDVTPELCAQFEEVLEIARQSPYHACAACMLRFFKDARGLCPAEETNN